MIAGSGAGYALLWYLPSLVATAVMPTVSVPHAAIFDEEGSVGYVVVVVVVATLPACF
jgi:hypothetical protein